VRGVVRDCVADHADIDSGLRVARSLLHLSPQEGSNQREADQEEHRDDDLGQGTTPRPAPRDADAPREARSQEDDRSQAGLAFWRFFSGRDLAIQHYEQ
jgi:hypothetical protein